MKLQSFLRGQNSLVADLGLLVLATFKALLATAVSTQLLWNRGLLAGYVNAEISPVSLTHYAASIAALLLLTSLSFLLFWCRPSERTARWLSYGLARIPEAIYLGGATVAAFCGAVAFHLVIHRSVPLQRGELSLGAYLFLGTFYFLFAFAVGRLLRWFSTRFVAARLADGSMRASR